MSIKEKIIDENRIKSMKEVKTNKKIKTKQDKAK
jgi:hypothetical protein